MKKLLNNLFFGLDGLDSKFGRTDWIHFLDGRIGRIGFLDGRMVGRIRFLGSIFWMDGWSDSFFVWTDGWTDSFFVGWTVGWIGIRFLSEYI